MKPGRRLFLRLGVMGLALTLSGCLTETYPLGTLRVQVLNESNVGIQGVLLDLYKTDEGDPPIYWRASSTNSSGVGVFGERDGGVIAGEYFIRVIFTTNHQLAPGESNDRPVTVSEGDNILVTFRAVPRSAPTS